MKIASIGAALALAIGSASARLDRVVSGAALGGGRRVAAGTKRGRQRVSAKTPHNRSKYKPHTGAKEQARAKRFYMVDMHPSGAKRSAPTMQQHSSTWFF
jgi:hypothetical protein